MKPTALLSIFCLFVVTLSAQEIEKDFLYDQHTLPDQYPYRDTTRQFQWDKIRGGLRMLDSLQQTPQKWAVLQNEKSIHGVPPAVANIQYDEYHSIEDAFGVTRYQSIPLYNPTDLSIPVRYGRDGSLVKWIIDNYDNVLVATVYFPGIWSVPAIYVHPVETGIFTQVIFVDRTNQNICTLEKVGPKWLVRSMNPATTGLHAPPFKRETPLGIFVLQEKLPRMLYYRDGTTDIGGFAPYANRFCSGAYIHGIPIDLPRTEMVELSPTLGTTPRSHMCVRTPTSHALWIYNWAPVDETVVFVIE